MKKTGHMVEITQHGYGRIERIERRIWKDEKGREMVKVEREWMPLEGFERNAGFAVRRFYNPTDAWIKANTEGWKVTCYTPSSIEPVGFYKTREEALKVLQAKKDEAKEWPAYMHKYFSYSLNRVFKH